MIAVTLDEWKKKLESPSREVIILHNPKVSRAGGQAGPSFGYECLPLALLGARGRSQLQHTVQHSDQPSLPAADGALPPRCHLRRLGLNSYRTRATSDREERSREHCS